MSENPLFQYQHFLGNPVAKPPCRMLNALMYGFFVKGDLDVIQRYIDNTLNVVQSPDFEFKAMSDNLMLTFTDIENIASKTPPFSNYGWMQETDIIFWLPVAQVDKVDNRITRLYWFPAFITVNNINALINGRETWGYNKYLCRYEMPNLSQVPTRFSLSLETFQPFTPETKMDWHTLLEIDRIEGDESWFSEIADLGAHIADFLHDANKQVDVSLAFLKQLLSGFVHPQMDQILFKQFPDGEGKNAVYQAVMHSPSDVKRVHKLGLLKHDFNLTVNQVDAYPLKDMFGVQLGTQKLDFGFYVLMDFDQQSAKEIIERGI
ncbi:acetoacetate decarboxylase family protein [Pseudoalteromonas xiamenensis]